MTLHLDFGNIGIDEKVAVLKALDSGQISTATSQVTEFEQKMAKYLGASEAVATNSGTAALHLALLACGIGPGDEVILPVTTFVASANAITHCGAKPVFVDIDIDTWTIDPDEIEKALNNRTKAIMPVHLYGNPCRMDDIVTIAERYDLFVIEDAAESLGATHDGMQTGTIGDVGCFSFNGNKIMTTSGGGLLVSDNLELLYAARCLSLQGKTPHGQQLLAGYNYRMTGLEASLGLAQFGRLEEFLTKKRAIRFHYKNNLDLTFQKPTPLSKPSWWFTACLFNDEAEVVQKRLGIPARRVFKPLTYDPPYRNGQAYPNADKIYRYGLCLPCSTLNSIDDIEKVIDAIEK